MLLFVNLHRFHKYIEMNGVKEGNMTVKEMVNQVGRDSDGIECTPLMAAAEKKKQKIVDYLVDILYADEIELVRKYKKEFPKGTPLVCACEKGRFEDVKLLIAGHNEKATGMTVKDMVSQVGKDSEGIEWTPLTRAARYEHFQVVKYLIEQGEADPNIADSNGCLLYTSPSPRD